MTETFSEFKNSFFYGSRADLNFKFLSNLADDEAADFLHQLMVHVVEAMDQGSWDAVVQHVIQGQIKGYEEEGHYRYDEGPFTPLAKPLSACRLGLLTSSGHFIVGDDPEPFGVQNMSQFEAMARIKQFLQEAPQLSVIPLDTPAENLRVRHGGYDIHGAEKDSQVVFPLASLKRLVEQKRIGGLHVEAYSFVGACAQTPLLKKTGPQWVRRFKQQEIDAMLLVPA